MANLKRRFHFKRWAPDIGENRDLPVPALFLEIATGLTQAQLEGVSERIQRMGPDIEALTHGDGFAESLRAVQRLAFVEAMGKFVRVLGGPHMVDEQPLATLEDYLALAQQAADFGAGAMKELLAALRSFNGFTGADELFSLRRSGGSASTAAPSVVKDEPKTEGP
jgi:hypothetical protein